MYAHTHACSNIFGSLFSCCYRQLTHTHTNTDLHTQTHTQKWIQIYRRGEFGRDSHSLKKMESRQK